MTTILGFRLSRRSLAVVAVSDFDVVFDRVRYLPTNPDRMEERVRRFVRQLVQQFEPSALAYYAPTIGESRSQRLVQILEEEVTQTGIPLQRLNKGDVFSGFSVVPLRTREHLRANLEHVWPEVAADPNGKVLRRQVILAEAAAAALLGAVWHALPPP